MSALNGNTSNKLFNSQILFFTFTVANSLYLIKSYIFLFSFSGGRENYQKYLQVNVFFTFAHIKHIIANNFSWQ